MCDILRKETHPGHISYIKEKIINNRIHTVLPNSLVGERSLIEVYITLQQQLEGGKIEKVVRNGSMPFI